MKMILKIGRITCGEDYYTKKPKRMKNALEEYNQAIAIPEGKARGLLFRAKLYLAYGQLEEALADLNHSIELDAEAPEGYHLRAQVYLEEGKEELAENEMLRYYELIPRELFFQEAYAELWGGLEEGTLNLDTYSQAITEGNDLEKAEAYFHRGLIFLQHNSFSEAEEAFSQALQLQPDHLSSRVEQAYLFRRKGQLEEALTELKEVAEKKKNHGRMLFHLRVTQELLQVQGERNPYVSIWEDIDPDTTFEIVRAFKKANLSYRYDKESNSITAAQNFTRMLQVLDEHVERAIDILEGRTEYLKL